MIGLLGDKPKMGEKAEGGLLAEDKSSCPLATQDADINKGNMKKAILTANYGEKGDGEGKCKACFTGVPRADAIVSSGRCEDYPCCGHEAGGCPAIDAQGRQRFRCATCATLMSHNARSAVCDSCHTRRNRYINEDPTWADHND